MGEWWRERTGLREAILAPVDVEPLNVLLAKLAGEALAVVAGTTLVDAIVMASAASRGDIVYSTDMEDLENLRRVFLASKSLRRSGRARPFGLVARRC